MQHTILVVDDNRDNLKVLKFLLESKGFAVHQAPNAKFAASLLHKNIGRYALAVVDYHMPEIMGDEATRIFQEIDPELQIITISGDDSDQAFDRNLQAGSFLFLNRTINPDRLLSIVASFCRRFEDRKLSLVTDAAPSDTEAYIRSFAGMVGASQHLVETCGLIERYAKQSESVLIMGENGTGKERVARAIHERSAVAKRPFVSVNCGAINENLIESELFGHVRGAFTGAIKDRLGHFREANGGTVFLDEIGDMPLSLQVKLLRVLQEQEITPVGATEPIKVKVRVIAATNVKLEKAARSGRFREDLYYRLNVLPIELKPLRERPEDIEPLLRHFAKNWLKKSGEMKSFRKDVIAAFATYPWPGNIRELENIASRLVVRVDGPVIERAHLDKILQVQQESSNTRRLVESYQGIRARHQQEERDALTDLVKEAGSLSKAARTLQIAKSTLHDRLKSLGINFSQKPEEKPCSQAK